MKVEYLAFPTDRFPCFGFPVCTEDGKQHLPEYDKNGTVYNFAKAGFSTMFLHKYKGDYTINKGDKRTYTYRLPNEKEPYIGTKESISAQLIQTLDKITNAPFSKLELAKFLKVDNNHLDRIKYECYTFIYITDKKYAKQWAKENYVKVKEPTINISAFINIIKEYKIKFNSILNILEVKYKDNAINEFALINLCKMEMPESAYNKLIYTAENYDWRVRARILA
jgi:hypothetical protein